MFIKCLNPTYLTYLKLLEKPRGIIINFNCTNIFKEGQKTVVNEMFKITTRVLMCPNVPIVVEISLAEWWIVIL